MGKKRSSTTVLTKLITIFATLVPITMTGCNFKKYYQPVLLNNTEQNSTTSSLSNTTSNDNDSITSPSSNINTEVKTVAKDFSTTFIKGLCGYKVDNQLIVNYVNTLSDKFYFDTVEDTSTAIKTPKDPEDELVEGTLSKEDEEHLKNEIIKYKGQQYLDDLLAGKLNRQQSPQQDQQQSPQTQQQDQQQSSQIQQNTDGKRYVLISELDFGEDGSTTIQDNNETFILYRSQTGVSLEDIVTKYDIDDFIYKGIKETDKQRYTTVIETADKKLTINLDLTFNKDSTEVIDFQPRYR